MQNQGLKLYKTFINDDPVLILTILRQVQIYSLTCLAGENCYEVIWLGKLKAKV